MHAGTNVPMQTLSKSGKTMITISRTESGKEKLNILITCISLVSASSGSDTDKLFFCAHVMQAKTQASLFFFFDESSFGELAFVLLCESFSGVKWRSARGAHSQLKISTVRFAKPDAQAEAQVWEETLVLKPIGHNELTCFTYYYFITLT